MTSGMGVKGTQGRCYGFYSDFKECQVRCGADIRFVAVVSSPPMYSLAIFLVLQGKVREELSNSREDINVKRILVSEMCSPHRDDYFECLHGFKENVRLSTVMNELAKQEYEAKRGPPPDPHHH